jgi:hypothetical protein
VLYCIHGVQVRCIPRDTLRIESLMFQCLNLLKAVFSFPHLSIVSVNNSHVRWLAYHLGSARPKVADKGYSLQIWRVAANILNKRLRTADKVWSSSLGVGRGANNSP